VKCFKIQTCAQIFPSGPYTDELGYLPATLVGKSTYFYEDNTAKKNAGISGNRCGKYVEASEPWWQIIDGNVYAAEGMTNDIKDNQYALRGSEVNDTTCLSTAGANKFRAGIPLSNATGNTIFGTNINKTDRDKTNMAVGGANFEDTAKVVPGFDYFNEQLVGSNLPSCPSTVEIDGIGVCRATGDQYGHAFNAVGLPDSFVALIDGNLTFATLSDEIHTTVGEFKAFIVRGKIIIENTFGSPTLKACPSCGDAQLQGVFIANEIEIQTVPGDVFNTAGCDKQLNFAGIIAQVGKKSDGSSLDLNFKRSFLACGDTDGNPDHYTDYNKTVPIHTFCYRPDLLVHAPTWMKDTNWMRFEAI
jgi:hypothetical protein